VHAAIADLSWYLGGGGSLTTLKTKNFANASGIGANVNTQLTTGRFKDSPFGWQLFGGLMFSENFGVSVKYADSGNGKDQWGGELTTSTIVDPGPPPITTETQTDLSFDGEMSIDGFTIYLLQTLPVSEKIEFTVEIGYSKQDIDFNWRSTNFSRSQSDDDTGFALGGIVRYKILRNWAISGEIEYTTIDFGGLIDVPFKYSLNGEYHF
jgi:opacity protein-like surface antigen